MIYGGTGRGDICLTPEWNLFVEVYLHDTDDPSPRTLQVEYVGDYSEEDYFGTDQCLARFYRGKDVTDEFTSNPFTIGSLSPSLYPGGIFLTFTVRAPLDGPVGSGDLILTVLNDGGQSRVPGLADVLRISVGGP